MTPEERQLLNSLADRVKTVPVQQKDLEADTFLHQLVQERPDTPYILAQTVIMQDFALHNAQAQIEDLQRQLSEDSQPPRQQGSFLGGLFGGGSPHSTSMGSVPRVDPWGRQGQMQPPQGYGPPEPSPGSHGSTMPPSQTGDFLRNAASTATGVAGGALLFQGISSLFSGHHGGMFGGNPSSASPRESLSETTITNKHLDDKPGDSGQHSADGRGTEGGAGKDGLMDADDGADSDFDDDGDYGGGGDDYA
jgi:uncharacterized protein